MGQTEKDNQVDFTCDGKCPFEIPNGVWCCKNCQIERKGHVNKKNRRYWTKKNGFKGKDGCRLPRDKMPADCRTYDCKDYGFDVWHMRHGVIGWNGEGWAHRGQVAIEDGFGHLQSSIFAPLFKREGTINVK